MGGEFTLIFKNKVAVIMAGGKSSRMKKDKALLPFGSYSSLAEYQYRRLSKIFPSVYLSAKINKFDFEVPLLMDKYLGSSPLVALVSIFESLEVNEVFVLSVDAPFVEESVIEKLYNASCDHYDVVLAQSKKGVEPLCAIYHRSFLKEAKSALSQDQHRLQSLFDSLNVKKVLIENEAYFMNMNYPEDYEKAKLLAKTMS